ncbi:MAG: AI-2E family transporter [Rubrivivax sp. SCN 70-15]|nr:MAG: AI-2E family transporter [Rubrivivax sp. SCN 70-15]
MPAADNRPDPHAATYLENRVLLVLLFTVSLALGWILLPFYGTVLWACIIALLFAPLYHWLLPRLRQRRTSAALLTLLCAVVMVILPFAVLSATLAREAMQVYALSQSDAWDSSRFFHRLFDALPAWVVATLDRFDLADFDALQRQLTSVLALFSRFVASHAIDIGQETFAFVAELFITVYMAFFLIRDGESIVEAVRRALPLAPEHRAELSDKFAAVVRATVKGSLLVAAIQGALGGLAFWFLGVRAALLWGVLMAFLSLLPALGAALVWLPVALYLLVTAPLWQGLALIAYGVAVIGLADNVLRPMLVGRDTRMPDYVVMITTLGGMATIGINGFVVGPTIAAMFIAVWHIRTLMRDDAAAGSPPGEST